MTCIVGYTDPQGGVWIGADRAVSWGSRVRSLGAPKLEQRGDVVVGTGGEEAAMGVLRDAGWPDMPRDDLGTRVWWLGRRPELLAGLKECGVESEPDGAWPVSAVVARRDGLWIVDNGLGLERIVDGEVAIGTGCDFAEGALYAVRDRAWEGVESVVTALRAAAARMANVAPPFDVWRVTLHGVIKHEIEA